MSNNPETAPKVIGIYEGTGKRPVFFRLYKPVEVALSDGSVLTIPEGYTTNFASVPRALWNVLPPMGVSVTIASLVHDYLYDNRKGPTDWSEKKRADREFYYLLNKYNPRGEIANKFMYVGVKLFGRKQFREE